MATHDRKFTDRDNITLGNPFGHYARGRAAVSTTLASAAAKYRGGKART